jgi:hypothetical protein
MKKINVWPKFTLTLLEDKKKKIHPSGKYLGLVSRSGVFILYFNQVKKKSGRIFVQTHLVKSFQQDRIIPPHLDIYKEEQTVIES